MVMQEIESIDLDLILEKVESVTALGLPFTLTAEVQTKMLGEHQYRSLLYTLCVEAASRGLVRLTAGGNWLVKE